MVKNDDKNINKNKNANIRFLVLYYRRIFFLFKIFKVKYLQGLNKNYTIKSRFRLKLTDLKIRIIINKLTNNLFFLP